jgi:hypothetical protein
VIVLRAGLRGHSPQSRGRVAARVHRSVARVGRLERRALRSLQSGCGGAPDIPGSSGITTATTTSGGGDSTATLATLGGGDLYAGPPPAPKGESGGGGSSDDGRHTSDDQGAVKGATAESAAPIAAAVRKVLPTAGPEILLPMLAALLGLAWFAVWFARRRGRARG